MSETKTTEPDEITAINDLLALLRANCSVKFQPLGGGSTHAVVTPSQDSDSIGAEIATRVTRWQCVPMVFNFSNAAALAQGLRGARRLFVCDFESIRDLLAKRRSKPLED
jgi:hypothetical protein